MKKFLHSINIALLFALANVFTGCSIEPEQCADGSSGGDHRTVTLKMTVPGANTATRAIGESQENAIQTIDVIAFAVDGSAETYDYWTVAHPTSDNVAGAENQHFTVELRIADYPQRFVVIANAHSEVNALIASRNWTGDLKSDLLSKLEYAFPSGTERWTSTSSADFMPIPMWGESAVETISSTTSTLSSDVYMMRMAARVDVMLDTRVAGLTGKFKLKSVALYNTNTGGLIAPDATAVQDRPHLDEHYYYVTGPSIPAERVPFSARNANAINYTDFAAPGTTDVAMVGSIYTFEAAVAAAEAEAPCLVVGGIYGTDTTESYFRVDFITDDGQTRLPLMRNNLYEVNVVDVTGSGHATPEEAFNSKAVNITANVLVWNNSNMGDVIFDGQYSLSVSKGTVSLYKNAYSTAAVAGENALSIYTDNPDGWEVDGIVNATDGTTPVSWLSLNPLNGTAGTRTAALITASANNTGAARSAIIWISAGRLRYPITVTQSVTARPLALNLTNASGTTVTEMVFSAAAGVAPASQTLNVNWQPTDQNATVATAKDASGSVAFPSNSGAPAAGTITSGTRAYTIAPPALTASELGDPFYVKASKVDFTLNDGVTTLTKSVVLKQLNYNIQVTPAAYYVMNGSTYTLNVRANTTWMVKSIVEKGRNANVKLLSNKTTDNLYTGVGSTGSTASPGEPLSFTVANTPGNWGTIAVTFTSPEGRFADKTITLVMAAKMITVAGMGLASNGEGGDKFNLISQNSSNTSNQQGFGPTTPNKMMITPANFGTTATSTVICEGFNTNWYDMNGTGGTNQTLTSAMIDWAVQMNPDLVWIGGNCSWGDDISLRIKQEFLDKGKTVIISIQEYGTMQSMQKVVLGGTDANQPRNGWAYSTTNQYSTAQGAIFQFADIADPILEGPFGNLRGKYWGTQYDGSYAFAVQGNSTNVLITYSSGDNKSGNGTNIDGYAPSWTTCFRAKQTNLIWICDDGFVRNDNSTSTTLSPFLINSSTFVPITKNYGGGSTNLPVSNSAFVANALAWVVARNPKQ